MNPLRLRRTRRAQHAATGWGLVGPDAVAVGARTLRFGERVCRTLAVTGYPREVSPGWLDPIVNHPGTADVAVHVEPIPPPVAADRLRRQLARLESTRRADADHGSLVDPNVEVAATDAADLADRLARGEGRLFHVGVYVTIHAPNQSSLDAAVDQVRGVLASLLLDTHPATYRMLAGWATTLPVAIDALTLRRTFDTDALAAAYPFTTTALASEPEGVVYGQEPSGRGLVVWDRFAQDNHNAVILARSGAGKSYLTKLETLRSLYRGIHVAVIDPEDEYRRLAEAVGGTHLPLGAPGVRVNPFDLDPTQPDALTRRGLFIHTLIAVLLRTELDTVETAALDRAIVAAYHQAGITSDPRTHARPAPVLADLATALKQDGDPVARGLAGRLAPYVTGLHRGLFDGPTTHQPTGHLVVFSLRHLPDEVKAAGTLLTLDAIWRRVTNPTDGRRRLVVVDEAWLLMRDPAGARFLARLAKAARKHWAGLTVVTQDAADLLATDLGQAVVSNAATQILLRQAPQAIDRLAAAFRLSDGEQHLLVAADRGHGILITGTDRVAFHVIASDTEHRLVTSNPAELTALQRDEAGVGG